MTQTSSKTGQQGSARDGTESPEELKRLSETLKIPFMNRLPLAVNLSHELVQGLDVAWARKNRLVPIEESPERIQVAISSPLALSPIDEMAHKFGRRIEIVVAPENEILKALNQIFSESMDTADDLLLKMAADDEGFSGDGLEDIPDLIDSEDSAPVIKLVNHILFSAVEEKASDIHIEPGPGTMVVRYRIDGILYNRLSPPKQYLPFLSSRVKVMAGLDIAEKRLPQDGRFQFSVAERSIDVRVSVIPTSEGERLVLRLLDKGTSHLELSELGLAEANLALFARLVDRTNGIILSTGPTGSGKTTTLYTAISRLDTQEINIITIEDPVEYNLPGVGQIQVNSKIGLTFSQGLRSVLRHDPDVIMIGEIRDLETSEIAIQAALTGHLVFSTIHTNDAPSSVTRLVDMGVEPYLVSSTIQGVVAQRLVRLLCTKCRVPYVPDLAFLKKSGLDSVKLSGVEVYKAEGCPDCFGTGYKGRIGIFEIMEMNDEIRACLVRTPAANAIREVAIQTGMETLLDDGLKKVKAGLTSIEEILRVTVVL